MLDRLIAYMKSKSGVWFATLEQIANHVKAAGSSVSWRLLVCPGL
jgi:hypothetical protein